MHKICFNLLCEVGLELVFYPFRKKERKNSAIRNNGRVFFMLSPQLNPLEKWI